MDRLLVLRLQVHGCTAEASLNGVPLARAGGPRPVVALPVHEFTLAGDNELTLQIDPPPAVLPPGAPPLPAPEPHLADGPTAASVQLLLPRVGQPAHPAQARTLAQLDWAAPAGEVYETPLSLTRRVALPISFPRWRWLDVPVVAEPQALRAEVAAFVQRLAVDLLHGRPEGLAGAARLRFEELALAYQRRPADELGRWRLQVADLSAAGPFKPALVGAAALCLRPVADGRLLECLAADGRPALRGASADGRQWQWPLRLARIDGQLHVLR